MKRKLEFLRERFFNVERSIRLVLFNIITLTGIAGGIIGLTISAACQMDSIQLVAIFAAIMGLVAGAYIANRKNRLKLAATGIVAIITLVLFPIMFFTDGGAFGGMGYWFGIGLLFDFLLIDGIVFYILLVLQILVITACYLLAYFFPEIVVPLETTAKIYIDMLQSLFVLGISVGVIVRFQNNVYKKAIQEIRKKNEELERSEQMAESANRAKSEFLSNVSHEIRTPLNAIMGMNEMILRETKDSRIAGYAGSVQNSSSALLSIINDILDIAKIEAGKLELAESGYEVAVLFSDSYNMIAGRAKEKGLDLHFSCQESLPKVLYGDCARVRQILLNLLTNAVKYTKQGQVSMEMSGVQSGNSFFLKMTVSDTGVGIEEGDLDRLFEKFERFDLKHNQGIEGTGLGMSIIRELVNLIGGSIAVESEYGKGSKFTVIIPQIIIDASPVGKLDPASAGRTERLPLYRQHFTAPTAEILLVDDMKVNLEVAASLLQETKIRIDMAASGEQCIALVQKKKYDMIFMDHMMPEMDGIETLRRMNQTAGNQCVGVPVIMLTANALNGMREQYLSMGFRDYLTKPVTGELLESMVLKYLPGEKVIMQETEKIQTASAQKEEAGKGKGLDGVLGKLPELQVNKAIAYCGGSRNSLEKILKMYARNKMQEELERLFLAQDWEQYQVRMHALKSTSLTIGLEMLSEQAKALERAAKEGDGAYISEQHEAVMQYYNRVLDAINENL